KFLKRITQLWGKTAETDGVDGKEAVQSFVGLFSNPDWQERLLAENTLEVLWNNPQTIIELAGTAKKINPTPS
ncbi:MAG: hypothetical protein ABH950_08400, partial [Candidatus Altiarchaeota archaeon]